MSSLNTHEILGEIKALIPDAITVKSVSFSRPTRDTLDVARTKVAKKLRDNVDMFNGKSALDKVDPVYRQQSNGQYAVGIKYGNRYLACAIAGGTFVPNVSSEKVAQLLELFAVQVEKGLYDEAIGKVMQDNVSARNKVAH